MSANHNVSYCMREQWIKRCRMLSVMLSLLLACFSASAALSAGDANAPITKPLLTQPIQVIIHHDSAEHHTTSSPVHKLHIEHRAPAKSLSPSLASILRNGSFIPERLHEAEPNYELVFEFSDTHAQTLRWSVYFALDQWHDWTLHPPATSHRIAGWKESNLLYRFISQADA